MVTMVAQCLMEGKPNNQHPISEGLYILYIFQQTFSGDAGHGGMTYDWLYHIYIAKAQGTKPTIHRM